MKNYDEVVSLVIPHFESLKDSIDKYVKNEIFSWIGREWLEEISMTGYGDLSLPESANMKIIAGRGV
ncbi:MAG: hypothetical protein ACFCUM_16555 [Bacteroidales bacterium]